MALPSNPWQLLWQKLPAPLQNRYYLTLVVFFFILIFLDKNSLWTQWRHVIWPTAGGARYNPNDWADYIIAFALPGQD